MRKHQSTCLGFGWILALIAILPSEVYQEISLRIAILYVAMFARISFSILK